MRDMVPARINSRFRRWLAACSLAAWILPAAAMDLTFRPIGENRGLDANMPVDLMVDRRGFLWVGSREGLFRYDGYEATLFKPDADDPASITDLDIRALYEDSDGIIWVATNTGGLNRFDPATGDFTHFRHRADDPGTISHDSVYGMTEDLETRRKRLRYRCWHRGTKELDLLVGRFADAHLAFIGTGSEADAVQTAAATAGIAKAFITELARQYSEDIPIWENKKYRTRPILCDGDGDVGGLRRWYQNFYMPQVEVGY